MMAGRDITKSGGTMTPGNELVMGLQDTAYAMVSVCLALLGLMCGST